MWDGFWFLANGKAWERLPPNLRGVVATHVNAAGVKERVDVANLNASLQKDLTDKGLVFNQAKTDTFRDKLRKAGFYEEWKAKYGNEAWAVLEKYSGKLA
jgi:TRAP-type C4-dicarboxylate transport system substrate-binding protein